MSAKGAEGILKKRAEDQASRQQQADESAQAEQAEQAEQAAQTRRAEEFGERTGQTITSPIAPKDTGGFILAILFWGWIVIPYLRGGTDQVKKTIRAKFINKGDGGKELP